MDEEGTIGNGIVIVAVAVESESAIEIDTSIWREEIG